MDKQKSILLNLLKTALTGERTEVLSEDIDWTLLVDVAGKHSVLPLLYDVVMEEEQVERSIKSDMKASAHRAIQQSYRLLFLSKFLMESMNEAGIGVVLLKGVATASYYPVPELRKSGDIDLLLLEPQKAVEAGQLLERLGFTKQDSQHALHHVVYVTKEGIDIEVHTMLAEPFDNKQMNQYLMEIQYNCRENMVQKDCMGLELPILQTAYHGYELLLHMLQHFLRSGFGLKLLCDWVVFWNHKTEDTERSKYLRLIEESGIKGFSDMVTLCCCHYLGLKMEYVEWMRLSEFYDTEAFLAEILEAEEFGKSSQDRMVVLRGTKLADYIREFHHQMQLNFPKKSKIWVLWPALWIITLHRFLYNNRNIRGISSRAILKKAKQRSKMMEQMALFQKEFVKSDEKE